MPTKVLVARMRCAWEVGIYCHDGGGLYTNRQGVVHTQYNNTVPMDNDHRDAQQLRDFTSMVPVCPSK